MHNFDPDETIHDLAMDASGNVYICGTIADNSDANGLPLTTYGLYDIVVAKYNCEGDLAWIKTAGGSGVDIAYSLALDSFGHLYITGRIDASIFTPCNLFDTIITESTQDFFLAKLDTSGNRIWIKIAGPGNTTVASRGKKIHLDAQGILNIEIEPADTGLLFPGYPVTAEGAYLMKMDTAGNVLRLFQCTDVNATINDFDIGPSGEYYTVSTFVNDSARIGNQTIPRFNHYYRTEMVIAKFDSTGNLQWLDHRGDTISMSQAFKINVVAGGDFYVAGTISTGDNVFVYGNDTLKNAFSNYETFAFLVKYNTAGQSLWGVHTDNQYFSDGGGGISIRPNGDVLFVASVRDTAAFGPFYVPLANYKMFLARVSSSGVPLNVDVFYSSTVAADYSPSCFVMDSSGNHAYIGGAFKGSLDVNGTVYPYAGGHTDCMLIRYGINCLVGIDELEKKRGIVSVFPNPGNSHITIRPLLSSGSPLRMHRMEVFNAMGKRVAVEVFSSKRSETTLDISSFAPGLYFVKVYTEKGTPSVKFVKQ